MFRTERNLPIVMIMYCSAETPKGYQLTLFGPRGADYARHRDSNKGVATAQDVS